jgi:predicted MFS family arabinose efflux permease
VLAAILAPSLVLLIGWRGSLAALGIFNFAFGFLFALLWREPANSAIDTDSVKKVGEAPPPLKIWALLPVSCATAIYLIGQMALITYVPLYLKDVMGYSAYWASQALALTQAGAMVGRVGWGIASDRLFGGRRKIVLVLIGLGSALLLGILSLMDRETSHLAVMPILFLAGVSLVGYQGVSYALIGEISGKARTGAGLGMMITINAAAATLGTPLFGYIVDRTGSYALAWQILAAAVSAGIVAVTLLLEEPRQEAPA